MRISTLCYSTSIPEPPVKTLTALISGLAGSALALTVFAPIADAAYVNPHQYIYRAAVDVGYDVTNTHEKCTNNTGLMGFVSHIGKTPLEFVICTKNAPYPTIAFTTIRHEGVHDAQICKGGMLYPEHEEKLVGRAQDEGWNILCYPEEQWGTEAESRVLANEWTAQEVANAIYKFCF